MDQNNQTQQRATKKCSDCNKLGTKDEFAKKQWKKPNPSCRLCAEYKKISQDKSRVCGECKFDLPRIEYDIYQWGRGDKAMCHSCRDAFGNKVIDSIHDGKITHKELSDGTCVCLQHSLECCDICMMDFTLPNDFARKRNLLGRELTEEEVNEVIQESLKDVRISRKICIMDGHAVCPRSSKKMRCPCGEVTYCSKACQNHHWMIHKMTCKAHGENKQKMAEKASKTKKPVIQESQKEICISSNICIMDGHAVCPKSGKKLDCPCGEVMYCSKACQRHHWLIHKTTCKARAENKQKKEEKVSKTKKQAAKKSGKSAAADLTEEQKNFARMEAFFAENSGRKHSIDECAWQLGEHPLVIGGGSVVYGQNGEEFIKGDVAKIYREQAGVEWDGSPRFGLPQYVQRKTPVDWIAKARQGKSQKTKDLEREILGMFKM